MNLISSKMKREDKFMMILSVTLMVLFMSVPDQTVNPDEINKINRPHNFNKLNKIESKDLINSNKLNNFSCEVSYERYGKYLNVTATKYNPVKSQCDDTPLITANNSNIDLDKLNSYQLRWCAISQDLLVEYKLGSYIYIESKNPKITGYWRIMDVMNSRWKYRIDLLMPLNDNTGFSRELVKIQKVKI